MTDAETPVHPTERLSKIEKRIEHHIRQGVTTLRQKNELAHLMSTRDKLKAAAEAHGKIDAAEDLLRELTTWMEVREEELGERAKIHGARHFHTEADHSLRGGLLGYLVRGGIPHEHPPPKALSRPWHDLIDAGPEGLKGVMMIWRPFRDRLSILHDAGWKIIKPLSEEVVEREPGHLLVTEYLLEYDRLGLWRLSLIEKGELEPEWWLRPFNEEEAQTSDER